jgi:triacylglycerol lipase
MVCPYWTARLPWGDQQVIDVWTHQQLISHPRALSVFREHLIAG